MFDKYCYFNKIISGGEKLVNPTHLVTIQVYIIKPTSIREKDEAGLRGWVIGLLEGKIPQFELEGIKIEKT